MNWSAPTRFLEENSDSTRRRAARGARAGKDVQKDRNAGERAAVQRLNERLAELQTELQKKLLASDRAVTDFQRFDVNARIQDVDRLMADAQADLANGAKLDYNRMADLGDANAEEPMKAAQLKIAPELPGLDAMLVNTAWENTLELLTQPMQQFASQTKVLLRQVALAGDGKMDAINRLREQIAGQGFDNAQYRAERIIRTELGRIFNQSTYDRLLALSKEFPFLRKGWRAAGDARTRLGHQQAGQQYQRGQGIPIGELFEVKVYDERPGKGGKLLGVAHLRFPVDPATTPQGRIAAGATIMCRCNAFVDFDLGEFAAFTAQAIQTSLGGVRPAVAPGPTAMPPAPPKPKTRQPRAAKKPAPIVAPGATRYQPGGPKVSGAANLDFTSSRIRNGLKALTDKSKAIVRRAFDVIDSVHGDGKLPIIPTGAVNPRQARMGTQAGYVHLRGGQPYSLVFGNNILKHAPHIGVFHETGHFLDHAGFDGDYSAFESESPGILDGWRQSVKTSKAIQTMADWRRGTGRPMGASDQMLDYMLSAKETWARSYAQWVATRSGNAAALKELANMQEAGTIGSVPGSTRFNSKMLGQKADPGSWDYPWQWSDEDFEPIGKAIDELMEKIGWRTKTTG
jgi:hypothetical protein